MVVNGFNSNLRFLQEFIFTTAMELKGTIDYAHQACAKLFWVKTGTAIHGRVVKFGFESNTSVRNTLIFFHANCGDLKVASALFDDSAKKDVVPWRDGECEATFDEVPERDVVTWNAMIAGYVLCGSHEQALEMFEEMRKVGEHPDEVTMLSLLSACADLGDLDIGNALIDMYAKCGSAGKALEVFRVIRDKDVTSWNSIIGGLAFNGHAEEALDLFREMQRTNIRPNGITFVGVLAACSHAGENMLGRAGLLKEAFDLIDAMKIEANAIVWRTLLGACRVHGNVELAKRANEQLLRMRKDQSGDYVLLSNLYASRGEWDGAEKVRKLMDDSGVKKNPGV
ncbi:pentatricopeptide repeat-containing protein [Senna tora]|uniref:Pentatricopeptide repeat-containing protein n=1 Tax=Senna tora TaxID=362788 RepID=A0A834SG94_9FABA|nr:pentatricopeptide repeat-containing protein [Senna tora]